MVSKILMPSGGQTASESTILKWRVSEGDKIDRGDILFEIETDKATLEVESFAKGNLLKICFAEGEKVEAGRVVAYIGNPGEKTEETKSNADEFEDEYLPIDKKNISQKAAAEKLHAENADNVVMASPAARLAAKNAGIDIKTVFEKVGTVVKCNHITESLIANSNYDTVIPSQIANSDYETVIPSQMRKTIARRMTESVREAPQFTVSIKADMSEFIVLRKKINDSLVNDKISFNDILVRCVCCACKKVPYINSSYLNEEIRLYKNINVGIAVALDDGLIVPVLKEANKMTLPGIACEAKRLIDAARSGLLKQDEIQGGTITISNLGMYGIDRFTALVNRPESAILAVGAIVETPIAREGKVEIRPIMNIAASFDHRVIDGSVGARFMAELKKLLESPLLAVVGEI